MPRDVVYVALDACCESSLGTTGASELPAVDTAAAALYLTARDDAGTSAALAAYVAYAASGG